MKSLFAICFRILLLTLLAGTSMARNPVPLINQPLVPASVRPGSKGFKLTVNGSGFASGAVVKWNGSPRLTVVNSSGQVQADIKASDVAKAGTANVTVVNPKPGGGTSNVLYLPIRNPTKSFAFGIDTRVTPQTGLAATADFNGDGIIDLAVIAGGQPGKVFVYLGKGDGSFRPPIQSSCPVANPAQALAVDVNQDQKTDLLVMDGGGSGSIDVLLGDGAGGFTLSSTLNLSFGNFLGGMAAGDLNGDGKLDLVANGADSSSRLTDVFLGNGDGTFQLRTTLTGGSGFPVLADFNRDGKLDMAAPDPGLSQVLVWLGKGDGSFGRATPYSTISDGLAVAAADVNGDGKLDLITSGLDVLLGNGDGTFSPGTNIALFPESEPIVVADFNGDGKLDVAVETFDCPSNCSEQRVTMLLGDGKGNFNGPIQFPIASSNSSSNFSVADFNRDGLLDYVVGGSGSLRNDTVYLQGTAVVKPTNLDFGTVKVGSHSRPRTATLTNFGDSAFKIKSISIGKDPTDFSETNNCGKSVPPHGSCKIKVTFSPQGTGRVLASLDIKSDGGSLLQVALSGTGKVITKRVSLKPSRMIFALQLVGTTSSAQTATLTNTGTQTVNISKIQATAPFGESDNCPAALMAGNSCQIQVTFKPTQKGDAKGALEVTDDAQGSPQKVALSGKGTVVKLSATSVNFGDQKVGTKSPVVPIKLTNVDTVALAISQIALTGNDPGDFSETNNCGKSVPPGGSCTIKVEFQPQKKGQRSADLSITDDGGGSPQQVGLFGNGT